MSGQVTHLGLVLPGSGYGPAGPALLVPRLAAEQVGVEVRDIPYPDWRPGIDDARAREFVSIVSESVREVLEEARPHRLTLLAKSLGCEVVARLDPALVSSIPQVEVMWGTPVFSLAAVRDGASAKRWRSLIVSGDADRWYDQAGTAAVLQATGGSALIVSGANHSLEVEGDVLATVDGFRRLAERVLAFLS